MEIHTYNGVDPSMIETDSKINSIECKSKVQNGMYKVQVQLWVALLILFTV